MRVYLDPSFLIALYVPEARSSEARALVERLAAPLLVNELQELEFKNGIRQKVLRKEITVSELVKCFRVFDDDVVAERIELKKVLWLGVFLKAEKLSMRHGVRQICRSFDLLHVAIAAASGVKQFATLDVAQADLAKSTGLKVLQL